MSESQQQKSPSSPSPASKGTSSCPASTPRAQWWIGGLFVTLVVLYAVGNGWITRVVEQLLFPLLLLAALIQWRAQQAMQSDTKGACSPWLHVAKGMWRPQGSGFYALIAALTFLHLQIDLFLGRTREAWGTWQNAPSIQEAEFFDFLGGHLWGVLLDLLMHVSVESILNAVWAGLWPMMWIERFDVFPTALLVGVAYVGYRLARHLFPGFDAVMHRIDESEETAALSTD